MASARPVETPSTSSSGSRLSPPPLVLIHGEEDDVPTASRPADIYRRARQKQLLFYPECRHGLDQCRDAIDRDTMIRWIAAGAAAPWKP